MTKITRTDWDLLSKVHRLNLINSCTGYKSANLIGTKSENGIANVAIFSSVTHLGSSPALLGFILRPNVVPRNTYNNIKATGYFTVNHIAQNMIAQAHQTSASYDADISEFEMVNLEQEYLSDIDVPFVKNSPIKLLCRYLNEYEIVENNTIHIIAAIEEIHFRDELIHDDYWLQLDQADVVTVNGLDGYCLPKIVDRFDYARPHSPTKSILKNGA